MDKKVIDITQIVQKTEVGAETVQQQKTEKVSNPIFKKLACFTNEKLSKKFDMNDLFR